MQEQQTATLTTIFSEVLADLAFMFTDDNQTEPSSDDSWLDTTIAYEGSTCGTLRFRCTTEFSVLLAANLLGTQPGDADADAQAKDAVKEFMNILCGQFITAMHGTEDVFNLSIPTIRELEEAPDLSICDGDQSSTLSVEGHVVQLSYSLDDGNASV